VNLSPRNSGLICILLSGLCLGAGFGASGQWVGLALEGITLAAWLAARGRENAWLGTVALVASSALAAVGLWAGGSPYLMLPGATLALASWDLTLFDHSLADNPPGPVVARLEWKHYQSLALVLGIGLMAAVAGRIILVQLPFVVLLLLVAVLVFCLERAWRTLHH
jgi:hypothetical protein